jgi:pimeloyl-ACP methyl ester carboxylesterase
MVHGVAANMSIWHFTVLSRLQPGRRVTTYDLRGHGRSDQPGTGYTSRDIAWDLAGILDETAIHSADVIGHSFGADIAIHLATLRPDRVRRIVAIEAGVPMFAGTRRRRSWSGWEEWAHVLERETDCRQSPEFWHRVYTKIRLGRPAPELQQVVRAPSVKTQRLLRLLTQTTIARDYGRPAGLTRDALSALRCPVRLLYRQDSNYLSTLHFLQNRLPKAASELLPNADHFGILNRIDPLADIIHRFLSSEPDLPDPDPST